MEAANVRAFQEPVLQKRKSELSGLRAPDNAPMSRIAGDACTNPLPNSYDSGLMSCRMQTVSNISRGIPPWCARSTARHHDPSKHVCDTCEGQKHGLRNKGAESMKQDSRPDFSMSTIPYAMLGNDERVGRNTTAKRRGAPPPA